MSDATFSFIPLDRLSLNDYNARRFDGNMTAQRLARFNELVASIREKGIIEPLLVRPIALERFEVIAGERRLRAAFQVVESGGLDLAGYQVPCMVRDVNDDDAFDLMVIENMQRDDLTPLESARAFAAYLERHGNTPDSVAGLSLRIGIPVHAIRRMVRLLHVPEAVLTAWQDGVISQSHVEIFTRIEDIPQTLELLTACVRNKLSARELAERVGSASPDLDRGFFDKDECQVCHFNTSVQSGLFSDVTPGGKCGNASCFEAKQSAFFTNNWSKSKPAEMFGTRGFRFGHRLGQDRHEPIMFDTAERCKGCDQFVSILRLNGTVVGGYACTCTGPLACFEELYRNKPPQADSVAVQEQQAAAKEQTETKDDTWPEPPTAEKKPTSPAAKPTEKKNTAVTSPAAPPAPPAPKEDTSPVYNATRGEKFRELYFSEAIPAAVHDAKAVDTNVQRLALLSLSLSSKSAKQILIDAYKLSPTVRSDELATHVYDAMLGEEVLADLLSCALAKIMDADVQPAVRKIIAGNFGVSIAREWTISQAYLDSLTKSELVRIGEEPGVKLWSDPKVETYREEHFKGKALMSLSKEQLVDMVMKSGVDLSGRVPSEVVGTKG